MPAPDDPQANRPDDLDLPDLTASMPRELIGEEADAPDVPSAYVPLEDFVEMDAPDVPLEDFVEVDAPEVPLENFVERPEAPPAFMPPASMPPASMLLEDFEGEAVAAEEAPDEPLTDESLPPAGPPPDLPELPPQRKPIAPLTTPPPSAQPPPVAQPQVASHTAATGAARFRLASLVAGALLIALGVIYVWPVFSGGFILIPAAILAIAIVGLALSLLAYWLNLGRRAPGALFVALFGLLAVGLTAALVLDPALDMARYWPLYLAVPGGALALTSLADRSRDRRLLAPLFAPGVLLVVAALAGLLVTLEGIPAGALEVVRGVGPWLLVVLGVALLPLAFRREQRRE